MNDRHRSAFGDRRIWMRGLYMLFFAIAYTIAELLVGLVALFQFVVVLFTGTVDERVLRFGRNLSAYAFQIWQFVTFNDERLPFPFSEWPDETPGDGPWRGSASSPTGASER